jgi:hypothetical protein
MTLEVKSIVKIEMSDIMNETVNSVTLAELPFCTTGPFDNKVTELRTYEPRSFKKRSPFTVSHVVDGHEHVWKKTWFFVLIYMTVLVV